MLSKKESYVFADFVRFIAMGAIIFQHSFLIDKALLLQDSFSLYVYFGLKVFAKIGSISFFTVSGFLLSAALDRYSPKEYLKKRLENIIKPYGLFVLLYLVLDSVGAFFGKEQITSFYQLPIFVGEKLVDILFYTSYWFIFNYFISVLILLGFYKYLYSPVLGAVLLLFTLLYSINVHVHWFPAHHTTAFIGFTFFLWLGVNLKKNEEKFWFFIKNLVLLKWIGIFLVVLTLNLLETFYLLNQGAEVVDSSLKITNILYALCVFIILCRVSLKMEFKWFDPRNETYPLYLVHPIFLKIINYGVLPMIPVVASLVLVKSVDQVAPFTIIVYQLIWFVVTYAASLFIVRGVLKTKFAWVFGK